ncbi:MAG: hypothetical protein AB7S26_15450 [Sandaracinaceae bacterium]
MSTASSPRVRPTGRVAFSVIGGVPVEVTGAAPSQILAHPEMAIRIDPSSGLPAFACRSAMGAAFPSRRMVEVADGLAARGAHVSVRSICEDDYGDSAAAIVETIARAARPGCD